LSDIPIGDHALISDCHTAALVTRQGSIDWLCVPRFDQPSVFGRVLDDKAGHWSITVVGAEEISRRYLDRTMVLETTYSTPNGTAVLVDAMAVGQGERGHDLGKSSPHTLLRKLTCSEGTIDVHIEFAPRPDYGLEQPSLTSEKGSIGAVLEDGRLLLSTATHMEVSGPTARTKLSLSNGERIGFALTFTGSSEAVPEVWSQEEISDRLGDTVEAWQTWSAMHQNYEGPWRDLVHHSGRVLQALTFRPTGAIVAAPTTSLPEEIGGERNWDYRFAWVRDASLTLEALWVAACPDEAHDFFAWMTKAAARKLKDRSELQIMFGIGGEQILKEKELSHLSGWRNSRPVRIGNGAWDQRQLDVYGELLSAAYLLSEPLGTFDASTAKFLATVADTAASRWKEPDQGIWEVRGGPQHFLYSKLMCWVALDRAISLAKMLDAVDRVEDWKKTRSEISDSILQEGWNEEAQAFTQALGSVELDASTLMIPIVGFLPATDDRVVSTIHAIEERLTDDRGLVFRYLSHDGLEGEEGTFLLCTFWLAQAQALAGEIDKARATFEQAVAYLNDVGLLAEEVDPATGELLGNFPQAFSHIGLVNAAWAIAQMEAGSTAGA
jgi:alpha,alpha-trehalase